MPQYKTSEEMNLLAKFAIAALPAIITLNRHSDVEFTPSKDYPTELAEAAYEIAAAMLAVHNRTRDRP